jgi:predicted glutamine amidotransferase
MPPLADHSTSDHEWYPLVAKPHQSAIKTFTTVYHQARYESRDSAKSASKRMPQVTRDAVVATQPLRWGVVRYGERWLSRPVPRLGPEPGWNSVQYSHQPGDMQQPCDRVGDQTGEVQLGAAGMG